MPSSRGSSRPRDRTQVSCVAGAFFPTGATREALKSEVAQLCPTLCDPMDYSPQGSSVHGIFQARILEWVDMPSSRGSSRPRDRTLVSRIVGRHFTAWATREDPISYQVVTIAKTSSVNCTSNDLHLYLPSMISCWKLHDVAHLCKYNLCTCFWLCCIFVAEWALL